MQAQSNGDPIVWALAGMFLVASLGYAAWAIARRHDRPEERTAGGLLVASMTAAVGSSLLLLLAGIGGTPANVPYLLVVVAGVWALYVRWRSRKEHAALTGQTLRRRLHWGFAAAAGFLLGTAAATVIVMAVLLSTGAETVHPALQAFMLVMPALGAAVAGYGQHVRQNAREQQIEEAARSAVGMPPVADRPPLWVPKGARSHWAELVAAASAPVKPGHAWWVLARAFLANAAIVGLALILAAGLPLWLMIVAGGGAGLVLVAFFAPLTLRGVHSAFVQVMT